MTTPCPKIAILGFHLEASRFCPASETADFKAQCWETGEAITAKARAVSNLPAELPGFYQRMDALGDWTPAPLIIVSAPPGGPASSEVWTTFMSEARERLLAAMPVDAVYVSNHGASCAENEDDTEAALLAMLREVVGKQTPIVVTHDLHCNVSDGTAELLDALIAYRTYPHIDQRECASDAADLIHEMLAGERMVTAHIRLPLAPPLNGAVTAHGPYAELVNLGKSLTHPRGQGPIANVAVGAGFVFTDLPHCGVNITVTARGDLQAARRTVLQVARAGWAARHRFVANTISVERAVELARDATQPLLFADVADNPGGGGRGNTTWLLKAFDQARIPAVLGVFIDPALVGQATELGVGAEFDAVFNHEESQYSRRYRARAKVLKLTDGHGVGRRGIVRGRQFTLGATCLLELAESGLRVVVASLRRQLAEPAMLEMHGIDIGQAHHVIVKSSVHYRGGFDEFFTDDRIHDVDSPGLTSVDLAQFAFTKLPRPVLPLDRDVVWREPDWAAGLA